MRFSIETRLPFLDQRLLEYVIQETLTELLETLCLSEERKRGHAIARRVWLGYMVAGGSSCKLMGVFHSKFLKAEESANRGSCTG